MFAAATQSENRSSHPDARVEPSRIVLVDLPRMLREIVEQAVMAEPDMVIVRDPGENHSLSATVGRTGADFVILGRDGELDEVDGLLETHPHLRVLAVAGDGREAFLYELRPTRTPLGEISPRTIVDAIRSARCATS